MSSINFALLNQSINRYVTIPFLICGTIGNMLNMFVFTRRVFQNNVCVAYFLASTVSDFFAINVGLLFRLLNGFGVDPTQNFSSLCKLRFFIIYYSGYASEMFTSLACIDRFMSSSSNATVRQMSTMKRAYCAMAGVIIFGFIVFGEQFYCIDINQQLLGAPQSCYQLIQNINCRIADSMMQFLFACLIPAILMIIFGLLTLRNVRQRRRIIAAPTLTLTTAARDRGSSIIPGESVPPLRTQMLGKTMTDKTEKVKVSSTAIDRTTQKRDMQLITMLMVQVIVFIISSLPISVFKLYSVATIYESKSVLHKSIDNTAFNVAVISLFVNNSVTFYINTLFGSVFRKELIKVLLRRRPT